MNSDEKRPSTTPFPIRKPPSLSDASSIVWDVIVIGAGPAGSFSARCAALNGLRTLLIEAKSFPRYKVCGGCLNPRAIKVLEKAGIEEQEFTTHAVRLSQLRVHAGRQSADFSLKGGISISRIDFDEQLLEAAHAAGAIHFNEAKAEIDSEHHHEFRLVNVRRGDESAVLRSRVVVCADGLSRSSVRQLPELSSVTSATSRIGIGAHLGIDQLSDEARSAFPLGTIVMTVASGGYIGITRAECNRLSVAAAFDPSAIKTSGSPEAAVANGLRRVGLPQLADSNQVHWQGTPGLTSHASSVAAHRVFVVGDAAGYIEPFTGEGMAAALESAWNAAPMVALAVRKWDDSLIKRWQTIYRLKIRRRQRVCQLLSSLLRFPTLVSASLPCFRRFPAAGRFLVSTISAE